MFELKPLSMRAIPGALSKAERYRLLGESWQAESICRDVLAVEPGNQPALVMLILSLTDQFEQGATAQDALQFIAKLEDPYERAYYTGIIHERRAFALFRHSDYRSGHAVYSLLEHAMDWYEKAQALRPTGNDDAPLRWNTCARFLRRHPQLSPAPQEEPQPVGSE